jgi:hypothetical protein
MMLAVSMARLMLEWISTVVHNQQEVLFYSFIPIIKVVNNTQERIQKPCIFSKYTQLDSSVVTKK